VQEYIGKLNQMTGKNYRLPTEAEWEYSARAGTTTARYWSDDPDSACLYGNVYDLTADETFHYRFLAHDCMDGYAEVAPVGRFQSNAFGLFDMLGNVWEWTCSSYADPYDGHELKCDNAAGIDRVLRGGSRFAEPAFVRSADRFGRNAAIGAIDFGFRLAHDLYSKSP
jgi:formylglycine-generating enzyme required for sulfatase activity